jgi:hypothetical protein
VELKLIEGVWSNQEHLEAINPHLWTRDDGFTNNCGNCAVANELRRRGYDVEARQGLGMTLDEFADMFDGAAVRNASKLSMTNAPDEMISNIEQDVLAWGEGARGAIRGEWVISGRGHLFSLEVRNGVVMYDNGQSGKGGVKHLERMKPQSIQYVRLDNTTPNDRVMNAVKNREA